jgi:hypothetical protein
MLSMFVVFGVPAYQPTKKKKEKKKKGILS